jgi:Cell division protein CrgA
LAAVASKKPVKRRVPAGRVTPKGTRPGQAPEASGRYTPPIPRDVKVSPRWVPVLMFTFLGAGSMVILCNYLGLMPGDTNNWYLLLGLGLILLGIVTATQYH